MPDVILSAQLTADVTNFNASIGSAAANIQRVEQEFRSSISVINGNLRLFGASAENTSQRVNSIQTAINGLLRNGVRPADERIQALTRTLANLNGSNGLVSVARGSNQAAMALTNVGRVAQDSSFGFIGIANNLNPLLESFQRLRAETGSNGAALRALGSSIMGAGGVGLALSAFQAIMLFSQMGLRAWTGATKDAKAEVKDYIESLDALTHAKLKGAQNAQKELTELKTLYAISTDATIALSKRKDAVDELQKKYPEYFKNLKDETVLNGGAKDAYDKLTTSIIATAKARAAQDLITKKASTLLLNEEQIKNSEAAMAKNKKSEEYRIALNKKSIADAKKLEDIRAGGIQISGAEANLAAISDKFGDARVRHEEYISKRKQINAKLSQDILNLEKLTTDEVKKGADITGKVGDEDAEKKVKTLSDILKELQVDITQIDSDLDNTYSQELNKKIEAHQKAINSLVEIGYKPATKAIKELQAAQNDLRLGLAPGAGVGPSANTGIEAPRNSKGNTKGVGISAPSNTDFFANFTEAQKKQYEANAQIELEQERFNKKFNDIVNGGLTEGLGDLGSAIGDALANGGNVMEAAGQSLLSSLGGILIELGKLAIQTGVGIEAIKASLKSLNPVVAITAGVALVALGSAIRSKAAAIGGGSKSSSSGGEQPRSTPRFASGVQNFIGGMALVGEQGPEFVNLPTGASVIPTGRTERMMRSAGTNVVVGGEMKISMRQLVVALRSEEKLMGRTS